MSRFGPLMSRNHDNADDALRDAEAALGAIRTLIAGRREPPELNYDDAQGLAVIFEAIQETMSEVAEQHHEMRLELRDLKDKPHLVKARSDGK